MNPDEHHAAVVELAAATKTFRRFVMNAATRPEKFIDEAAGLRGSHLAVIWTVYVEPVVSIDDVTLARAVSAFHAFVTSRPRSLGVVVDEATGLTGAQLHHMRQCIEDIMIDIECHEPSAQIDMEFA